MQLGVVGLGTMGANLARNAARCGAKVAVYNRTTETMRQFMDEYSSEGEFAGCETYPELAQALDSPRAILLMVKAGPAVDAVTEELLPHLSEGDIIIDGGNSHFADTSRREKELAAKGIRFVGLGVSGGEEGALLGPSLMPGGNREAYDHLEPLLRAMAAEDGLGGKCVAYLGAGGAGHFVKMVHNGIEYGVMQAIAESYDLLKTLGEFSADQLAETFAAWNQTNTLRSFLIEITADIFRQKDDYQADAYLVDYIQDAAAQKGTGKWTSQAALDYGVAVPTITAAVEARIISGAADLRTKRRSLPEALDTQTPLPPPQKFSSLVKHALSQTIICAYQQGFDLMETASREEDWGIDLSEVARIWRNGCIIRSDLLDTYQRAYSHDGSGSKAEAASEEIIASFTEEQQLDWRRVITHGVSHGVPLPAMETARNYYDSFRRDRLPQALIQAQRDYFGAHTYKRTDREGSFHTEW